MVLLLSMTNSGSGKKGRYHVQICHGTTCHFYRSSAFREEIEKILQIKAGQTSKDGKFSLEIVNCLGACSNAPVIIINGKALWQSHH